MAQEIVVTLDHYDKGPLRVAVYDEATWWMQRRQWTCVEDPELGTFEDGDFMETPEEITELLMVAKSHGCKSHV